MTTYTLYQLNEYIRRVLSLNLSGMIWVSGEIAQIGNSKGHYYIDLIEKAEDSGEIIAKSQAVLWQRTYRRLKRKVGKDLDALLQEGLSIRLKVSVDFHERFGLKLVIEDIDPTYTLGKLEMDRRRTIDELKKLQLLGRNRQLNLPKVLQRIAVISSPNAAGLQDYLGQLRTNPYGYQFENMLFSASVQGQFAEREIIQQLQNIQKKSDKFDLVIIIRGGGAKLDLMAFDQLALSKAVAQFLLPVLTGIGHDVNESVLDLVAHTALKTPTAVADYLVQHNMYFESNLVQYGQKLQQLASLQIREQEYGLNGLSQLIQLKSQNQLKSASQMLTYISNELPNLVQRNIKRELERLNQLESLNQLLSPEAILKRGYSISSKNGQLLRSTEELKAGDVITTRLQNGKVESEVKKIKEG